MQQWPFHFLFWSITPTVCLLAEAWDGFLLAEHSFSCFGWLLMSGVHFLELLIGQNSGGSRYDSLCGTGFAPAPILNPASGWSRYDRLHRTGAAPESIFKSSPMYTVYTIYTFYRETQLLTVQNKRSLIIPAPVKNQTSSFLSPVTIWLC